MKKNSPYLEMILYMEALTVTLENLDKPTTKEDKKALQVGVLNDLKSNIENLISKIS